MRLFDIARIAAFVSCAALLSACPKKDTEAAPEPAASAAPAAAPINDKAGAEPPAPAAAPLATPTPAAPAAAPKKKTDDDKGGW